jgi:predicted nuclease of restriction endonuclease-like (RecB) superfamily
MKKPNDGRFAMAAGVLKDKSYFQLLSEIKSRIKAARLKAAVSVNKELLGLYWQIGKRIVEAQKERKWGDSVIGALSNDLSKEFPGLKGFSRTNLFNIRKWHLFYSAADAKVQQLVGQLPWGHNVLIINKFKGLDEAIFYAREALDNSWSRNMLLNNIELGLYKRKGRSINYVFDFLALGSEFTEKDFEGQLVDHMMRFLLELGAGFAFVGKQYILEVSGQDWRVDLLFYHLRLRCFVAIELKAGEFRPEYAGKLNFYLSAIDDILKQKEDNPSIGIILCKTKDRITAEYSLRDIGKPIGVSEYKLVRSIPKKLEPNLPSVKEIEKELSKK